MYTRKEILPSIRIKLLEYVTIKMKLYNKSRQKYLYPYY